MRARQTLARCCLVACACGALGLHAQDSQFTSAFKIKGLLSRPSTEDGLTNNVIGRNLELGMGFGLEGGMKIGKGMITAEVGYQFLTGDEFLAPVNNLTGSTGTTTIDATQSVQSRKNKLEGMYLRVGYEGTVHEDLTWRAGLQFGGNTFTHQVIGNTVGTDNGKPYADSYFFVGSKSTLNPSPYFALNFKINESSSIEVGLLLLEYTALNYQHVANSNNANDAIGQNNKVLPNIEVGYAFHF